MIFLSNCAHSLLYNRFLEQPLPPKSYSFRVLTWALIFFYGTQGSKWRLVIGENWLQLTNDSEESFNHWKHRSGNTHKIGKTSLNSDDIKMLFTSITITMCQTIAKNCWKTRQNSHSGRLSSIKTHYCEKLLNALLWYWK